MTEDEFAKLMRRADPARATPQTVTEADLQSHFAQIQRKARLARRRRQAWLVLPAAAALLAALFVVQPWGGSATSAHAATPPMLVMTPTEADVDQVVAQALDRLAVSSDSVTERRAQFEGWSLELEEQGGVLSTPVVAPQVFLVQWRDDLSGRITATAGEAYVPDDGQPAPPPEGAAPAPGTILSDDIFAPGEMPLVYAGTPPSSASEMRAFLESGGAASEVGNSSYLEAVQALLSEWTLNAPQEAAVLQMLTSLSDVSVIGETTDRLGRAATALR
ncbi:MAG: hypothetical protein KIT69_05665, partial [Propionibacteriaceae bacterium]|nr:hypothetical protein [Propionibacteriaceae bacterium]